MWVKFLVRHQKELFFGNPLNKSTKLSNDYGFRLDTKVNEYDGKYYRYIRLIVRDWGAFKMEKDFIV